MVGVKHGNLKSNPHNKIAEAREREAVALVKERYFDFNIAHPGMTVAMAASIQSKIAFGERAGQMVRRVGSGFGYEEETPPVKGTQCATINGFNLHAKVGIAADARDRLLQLIKYVTRPPISNKRLTMKENGDLLYQLKTPWSDGTTAILLLSPEELCEKMAALVPPPNSHLTRYSGVSSPHSK
jgi:hypothetical protein